MKGLWDAAAIMITRTTEALNGIWDHWAGRVAIIAISLGWLPYYLLVRSHEALTQ